MYLNKPFIFYQQNNTSFLIQNINEVSSVTVHIRSQLFLFSEILIFFGILILLSYNNLKITLLTMLIFIIFGYFIQKFIFKETKIIGQKDY